MYIQNSDIFSKISIFFYELNFRLSILNQRSEIQNGVDKYIHM